MQFYFFQNTYNHACFSYFIYVFSVVSLKCNFEETKMFRYTLNVLQFLGGKQRKNSDVPTLFTIPNKCKDPRFKERGLDRLGVSSDVF